VLQLQQVQRRNSMVHRYEQYIANVIHRRGIIHFEYWGSIGIRRWHTWAPHRSNPRMSPIGESMCGVLGTVIPIRL
jgi:hypothetical protein